MTNETKIKLMSVLQKFFANTLTQKLDSAVSKHLFDESLAELLADELAESRDFAIVEKIDAVELLNVPHEEIAVFCLQDEESAEEYRIAIEHAGSSLIVNKTRSKKTSITIFPVVANQIEIK